MHGLYGQANMNVLEQSLSFLALADQADYYAGLGCL
jgi:hypothetical protein